MSAILEFLHVVIDSLLAVLFWAVIINAAVSWLVAFDIINLRNRAAYGFVRVLDRVTSPFLAPFRRFIPPIGGMDFSPLILIILIQAFRHPLLDRIFEALQASVGGGVAV